MMSKPFFTIIVVSYNAGERIERTLESIMTQSFDGFDVLIKDGMSTDGSVEKIKDKYGIEKDDLLSAELEIVPAGGPR